MSLLPFVAGTRAFGAEPQLPAELDGHVSGARTALAELDSLAAACLQNDPSATSSVTDCAAFRAAVNGTLLERYLQHCQNLKAWRANLAETSLASNASPDPDPQSSLSLLLSVESLCGDQALTSRTEHVVQAYARIRAGSLAEPGRENQTGVMRELREMQQEQLTERERTRLLESLDDQQRRQQQELQRQLDQQNLELLRRQLDN